MGMRRDGLIITGILHRFALAVLGGASGIGLALGIALLLLPVVLHLWLGADNDSYIVVAEGGRKDPIILTPIGLEWMFRWEYVALVGLVTAASAALKALLGRARRPRPPRVLAGRV
jgi:hypothetical protein